MERVTDSWLGPYRPICSQQTRLHAKKPRAALALGSHHPRGGCSAARPAPPQEQFHDALFHQKGCHPPTPAAWHIDSVFLVRLGTAG